MELFSLLLSVWRLRLHIGLAIDQPDPSAAPDHEPPAPMPRLEPLEPMAVVISDDDDPDLIRQRIGSRRVGFR